MLQNNNVNVHFLNHKSEKDGYFVFWSMPEPMVIFSGSQNHFYPSSYPILGHPVYQFLQKPEFSDFTVSGFGLPWGH